MDKIGDFLTDGSSLPYNKSINKIHFSPLTVYNFLKWQSKISMKNKSLNLPKTVHFILIKGFMKIVAKNWSRF